MKKAVILTRVSSKDQEKNYSLEAQRTRLSEYAKRKNLQVIRTFSITESATSGDREKFMEVINFCKAQNETVVVIVDAVDRLQRSFNELPMLQNLVASGKIELLFYSINLSINKDSPSYDVLNWEIQIAFAKSYINSFKAAAARGRNEKVMKKKMISWQAPCGYENYIDENGCKSARPKAPDATYLKKIFERYSLGGISIHQLTNLANKYGIKTKMGKKLDVSSMIQIIDNPFYYGAISYKGEIIENAAHKPLISKQLWEACQKQRKLQSSKSFKQAEIPFLYRGIFTDYYKNKICSNEIKKKKLVYVVCHEENGSARNYINENDITDQIVSILNQISIPKNFIEDYNLYIQSSQDQETAFRVKEQGHIKTEITKIDNRLSALLDMRLDGKLTDEKYNSKEQELNAKKMELEEKIQQQDAAAAEPDSRQISQDSVSLFSNLGNIFKMGMNIENKQILLRSIFKELKIKDGNVGYKLNEPFSYFMKQEPQASV